MNVQFFTKTKKSATHSNHGLTLFFIRVRYIPMTENENEIFNNFILHITFNEQALPI